MKVLGIERFMYNGEWMLALWFDGNMPDAIDTRVRTETSGEWVNQQIVGQENNKVYFHEPTNYNQDYGVIVKTIYRGMDSMRIEMPLSREQHY